MQLSWNAGCWGLWPFPTEITLQEGHCLTSLSGGITSLLSIVQWPELSHIHGFSSLLGRLRNHWPDLLSQTFTVEAQTFEGQLAFAVVITILEDASCNSEARVKKPGCPAATVHVPPVLH